MAARTGEAAGLVLRCDAQGTIIQVLRDDLGLAGHFAPGQPWPGTVDLGNIGRALSFLIEVQVRGAVLDWELNLPAACPAGKLHFAGASGGGQITIVGAGSSGGVLGLYEEVLGRAAGDSRTSLYDQISHMNNELVTLQRELAKKHAELDHLNRQKDRFLGMAAHDLRTPLSAIMAYSDLLADEATQLTDEEREEFLSIIRASSEFMRQLVDDLLDVAQIESGVLDLDLQPVDLVALTAGNVALNRALAARKQIALHFQHHERELWVPADPMRIEQVLNNLIGNALKFSPRHTTVRVQLTAGEDRAILAVADEGPGMAARELDSLFRPFERTSVRSTEGEKSSGLGLAIARRIVTAHRGRIWVQSIEGQGSTFYVALPLEWDEKDEDGGNEEPDHDHG